MADVVVTVPKDMWAGWLAEGDLPGEPDSGQLWDFYLGGHPPEIGPGDRVYVVSHGRLRGYAPLLYVNRGPSRYSLVRGAGAVACTIAEPIRGFRGFRYRWWKREDERPFPEWKTEGVVA